jgi:antitoxin CptB
MTEPEHASLDARRRRLLFRATHRGTYENDILLGGFVQRHIATFCESDLAAVEDVLELPDNDLADWLTGRSNIPADRDTPMLRRIREDAGQVSPSWSGVAISDDRDTGVDGRATPDRDGGT